MVTGIAVWCLSMYFYVVFSGYWVTRCFIYGFWMVPPKEMENRILIINGGRENKNSCIIQVSRAGNWKAMLQTKNAHWHRSLPCTIYIHLSMPPPHQSLPPSRRPESWLRSLFHPFPIGNLGHTMKTGSFKLPPPPPKKKWDCNNEKMLVNSRALQAWAFTSSERASLATFCKPAPMEPACHFMMHWDNSCTMVFLGRQFVTVTCQCPRFWVNRAGAKIGSISKLSPTVRTGKYHSKIETEKIFEKNDVSKSLKFQNSIPFQVGSHL